MTDKDYVSKDVAILLSKIGFEEKCSAYYNKVFKDVLVHANVRRGGYVTKYTIKVEDEGVLAPTLYEAQMWLIDKFGLFVHIDYDIEFIFELIDVGGKYNELGENIILVYGNDNDSYQEALNNGIKDAIEKFILKWND